MKRFETELFGGDPHCAGCWYYSASHTCDYIFRVGHRRPCPPGKGCTCKITRKDALSLQRKVKWDTAAGEAMYREGRTDRQIAAALGTTVTAVASYRRRHWKERSSVQNNLT